MSLHRPGRKTIISAVLCAALVAVPIFVAVLRPAGLIAAPAEETRLVGGINLSGFDKGTRVTYRAAAQAGPVAEGKAEIDEAGRMKLPPLQIPADTPPGEVVYTITIIVPDPDTGEDHEPVRLIARIDEKTGRMSMKGAGFGRFEDLKIFNGGVEKEFKADWAGLFDLQDAGAPKSQESLRLAFQRLNAASDAPDQSPLVIDIFTLDTPGLGGGPTDQDVNTYTPRDCNDPEVDHSICDVPALDRTPPDFIEFVVAPLVAMSHELTAVMFYYLLPVGTLFDAKTQLETQRKHQELRAAANKDYQPSETMCRFGSYVKSLAQTEEKMRQNKQALNAMLTPRYRNAEFASSTEGYTTDIDARIDQFRRVYCDINDNNSGLRYMCDHDQDLSGGPSGAPDNSPRINRDVDYTRLINNPLTLEIDFADAVSTADEEDVMALAKHLYWPRPFPAIIDRAVGTDYQAYLAARRHMAAASVAHSSFINLVAEKSSAVDRLGTDADPASFSGWSHMKAMMREFGLSDADIHEMLGANPSYYAQMDILTKKIYQNPQFFTNLYDKPVNVERINVALDAISLMQGRDRFEAMLRREMLGSLLVEQALQRHQEEVNVRLFSGMKESQR